MDTPTPHPDDRPNDQPNDQPGDRDDDRGHLALRIVTMPKDTNQYGTIFGGVILSYIDQAGFVEARRHGCHRWVTAAIDRVEFKAPVIVGDTVSFNTRTVRTGTKSVTVAVDVVAERYASDEAVDVTHAQLVMVAVDADGTPIPFDTPATVSEPGVDLTGQNRG